MPQLQISNGTVYLSPGHLSNVVDVGNAIALLQQGVVVAGMAGIASGNPAGAAAPSDEEAA